MTEKKTEFEDLDEEDAKRYVDRVEGLDDSDIPLVVAGYNKYIKAKTTIGNICDAFGVVIHMEDFMPKGVTDMIDRMSDEEKEAEAKIKEEKAKTRREIVKDAHRRLREKLGMPKA